MKRNLSSRECGSGHGGKVLSAVKVPPPSIPYILRTLHCSLTPTIYYEPKPNLTLILLLLFLQKRNGNFRHRLALCCLVSAVLVYCVLMLQCGSNTPGCCQGNICMQTALYQSIVEGFGVIDYPLYTCLKHGQRVPIKIIKVGQT